MKIKVSSSLLASGCNRRIFSLEACIMVWLIDLRRPNNLAGDALRINSICTRSISGLVSSDWVRMSVDLSLLVLWIVYQAKCGMSICILTWVNEKFCKCELEESLGADKSAVSTIN